MAKFSDEQKNFIVRALGTTSSPAKIRRCLFLQEYKLSGRAREQFKLFDFKRINKNFHKNETIFRKKNQNVPQRKRQKKLKSEHLWVKNKEAHLGNSRLFSIFLQLHIGESLRKRFTCGSILIRL